ncbi:MAG: M15 family metallopeptidase, partial [Oscillochloris sp.]|nr:M15 family metallopeptidase [Oscillochloris sp.]
KRPTAGYDGPQLRALHALIDDLLAHYRLDDSAIIRLVSRRAGHIEAVPYVVPPAPAITPGSGLLDGLVIGHAPTLSESDGQLNGTYETELPLGTAPNERDVLLGGAGPSASSENLWELLYGETCRARGGTLRLDWAFTIFAAAKGLGAPVAPNPSQPLISGGVRYNFQPFARDTIYNIGADYSDVRRLSDLLGSGTAIPAGPGRDLLAASYRTALEAAAARGVALTGNQNLHPGWKFHQVARSTGLGPALSGNYLTTDKRYIVQVFAGDTLFTPATQPTGCQRLSETAANNPAYGPVWGETYKAVPASYDPNSPFQQLAVRLHLGTPLTTAYNTTLDGASYTVQVFALDTLYRGADGVIRRMSDLPLPDKVGWPSGTKKLAPTPQPDPQPRRLTIDVGQPRRSDPSWPPPPPFKFLAARTGVVEATLGHIEWQRVPGSADKDAIRITNGWDEEYLVVVDIPQLRKFRLAGFGKLRFHRKAAAQLVQLFADWEAAGLLGLILSFDGAFNPRTIRSQVPGQTTNTLSNHAYGTAFDINAAQNGFMQQPALVGEKGSVRELVPLAYANGFYWGGHFTYTGGGHDGMHFEWAVEV